MADLLYIFFSAIYDICFVTVREITVHTPNTYGYNNAWFVTNNYFFSFRVRSCSEVRLLLTVEPYQIDPSNEEHIHEIVIGGWQNTRSVIYLDTVSNISVADSNTPNILSCNEFRQFWIQWTGNGAIAVGQNELGTSEFLRYVDTEPHRIYGISISTGAGSTGEWHIPAESGWYS